MTIDALKQAALQTGPTNPFAVSYLQLCQLSYLAPDTIPTAVAQLPTLNAGGSWQCGWGPAQTSDQSNLAFVANYFYGAGLPVFTAVVVRGTDVNIDNGWGILEQVWEDLDVTSQVPLPWTAPGNALVAKGTLDGLSAIQGLLSGGQTLLDYVAGYVGDPQNNTPVLVVTGHSLGACLTTVVAPWLKVTLGQRGLTGPIVPATFAGPTAGNSGFAQYFSDSFPYFLRYFNTLDIIPRAWADLPGIETIYDAYGLQIPDLAEIALIGFETLIQQYGVSYAQPPTNNAPLTGAFQLIDTWYQEAAWQHHTTTYMTLLGGQSVVVAPPRPALRPQHGRAKIRAQLGAASTVVRGGRLLDRGAA
ncbi:lipase family protein [Nitrospirillum iridis]|uniref:Fungal lipase-type domain-containing protein n=1 Tax=Nitrospirillum iridis TaxID=765888 RepID=A0A7X0AX47_9PROT|nr:hypothetical protein [Nitrospirillum iridis]MBB6251630.1 hypothetical protein [Nitrospirillum iridis]